MVGSVPVRLNCKQGVNATLRCPNCGEDLKDTAKFCSNCGLAIANATPVPHGPRPVVPFVLSVISFIGMVAVAISMTFIYDAPGDVGSPIEAIFHEVGAVEFIVALGVLVSAIFLVLRGFDARRWAGAIAGLGVFSVAALLVVVAEGTFAVIFLSLPGIVAVAAGLLGRRASK